MKRDAKIFFDRKVAEIKNHQTMTPYEKERATAQAKLLATLMGIASPETLEDLKGGLCLLA